MATLSRVQERALLDAARGGDEDAYRSLVEPLWAAARAWATTIRRHGGPRR